MPENALPPQNDKRLISLDLIKILAAFMVVFYHFRQMDLGHFENGFYIMSVPQFLLCFCSASIPLFFMVNGALMLNKNLSTSKIYAKAGRLALISLVWNTVAGFYVWFFNALIVLYLLYPILIKAFNAKRKIWLCGVMGCVFLFPFLYNFIMLFLELFCPDFSFSVFGLTVSLHTIPTRTGVFRLYSIFYFLLGGIILNKKFKPVVSVISVIAGLGITVFDVIVTSNYLGRISDGVNSCFPTIGGLLVAFGIFNLFRGFDKIQSKKFAHITASVGGGGVLMIYLLHVRIRSILYATVFPRGKYPVIVVLGVTAAVCLVCVGVSLILKKIPLVKELVKL